MDQLIKVMNLEKCYGDKEVVKKISFEIKRGEILCFLGPNGAGKSTTINILAGVLGADGGEIQYKGKCIRDTKKEYRYHLGVVPQDLALYEDLTAIQNVRFFASLYGLKGRDLSEKAERALSFVGLKDRKNQKVKTFSGGMKRRLNIACAIAHEPELVIMDEPTVGIDPQSRNHILESIRELRSHGMTVLYTTHYMEEVEEISTRIIIMDDGLLIAEGTKEELKESISDKRKFILTVESEEELSIDEFYRIEGVMEIRSEEGIIEITTLKNVENLDKIISLALSQNIKINNIMCRTANLETVFLSLTGKSLRDE
ncbi:ABC transporter ATP-binding protein [Robinsoniella peoriensis]|uniref:ABC transporter ATP-binding protein n=1 Tax=Robinsoniella peoriensis TaxID=180332 RepID=UPI0037535066